MYGKAWRSDYFLGMKRTRRGDAPVEARLLNELENNAIEGGNSDVATGLGSGFAFASAASLRSCPCDRISSGSD
jgi:hypothetical protein